MCLGRRLMSGCVSALLVDVTPDYNLRGVTVRELVQSSIY
jgi:hypothetical protein